MTETATAPTRTAERSGPDLQRTPTRDPRFADLAAPVRTEGWDGSRVYTLAGTPYPSVTTVLSATTSKPWLTPWAAKSSAEYAVDHLTTIATVLAESGRAVAVKLITGAADVARAAKRDDGSFVHDCVEAHTLGLTMPDHGDHERRENLLLAYLMFMDEFGVEPFMSEVTVCHREFRGGYAGTADMGAVLRKRGGQRWLIDIKTGNVEADHALQLHSYWRAQALYLEGEGVWEPMPEFDRVGILHLRDDATYQLLDVTDEYDEAGWAEAFGRRLETWHEKEKRGGRIGTPARPFREDGTEKAPAIRDLDGLGQGKAGLMALGFVDLEDLALHANYHGKHTVQEQAKGVGPKVMRALDALMERYGLEEQWNGGPAPEPAPERRARKPRRKAAPTGDDDGAGTEALIAAERVSA